MSRVVQVPRTDRLKLIPNSYTNTGSYNFTNQTISNAYTDADSTSSNRMTLSYNRNSERTSEIYYEFDKSNLSSIPSNATIDSITANVRYAVNDSTYVSALSIQLYNNTTAKGSAVTTSSTTNATSGGTKYSITPGSWTRSELNNIRLYISATHNASKSNGYLYFYGADVTINYSYLENVTEYQISVTNNSSVTVSPTGTNNWVAEEGSQTITFTNVSDVATLSIVDRVNNVNTNVTSQLINTGTRTYTYTISNISEDHTITVSTVTAYNITASSEVPSIATVNPSSGRVGQGSNFNITIVPTDINAIKVYDNNTDVTSQVHKKLVPTTITDEFPLNSVDNSGTATYYGSYPLINGANGVEQTANHARIAPGTANVSRYAIYNFDINIPEGATIISVSCQFRGYPYNTSYVTERTVQLYSGTTAKGSVQQMTATSYNTVTNIADCGTWTAAELNNAKLRVNITATNGNSSNYTIRFYGATLTVQYSYDVESETDYEYTVQNVQSTRTVIVREAPYFEVTGSSTFDGKSVVGVPKHIYISGSNYSAKLAGITNPYSFRLTDNDFDVTSFVDTDTYEYTISAIQEDHILVLEEAPYYSVTEGSSTLSGATLNGTTNKAYEGTDVEVSITGVSNPYSIKLLDNGVDVSDNLVIPSTEGTYEVSTAPGATYGFNLNTGTGYYTSTNVGIDNSAAVARVTFNLGVRSRITIKYINYAEATYDYGIFGNIDSALGTTYTAETTGIKYACSSSSDNTSDEQTLTYDINKGEHFIDIKFRKDNYTDKNNDSLQFKIDSIVALDNPVPVYSITSISENHVLTLSLQDTVTVTTSSSYNGASLAPVSATIYKGEPLQLTLTVSDISLVSVRVTNSKTSMVTGIFTDNGNGTYTGILTVRENSTVTVIQKVTYTITCTDNATNGNITPTGTQSIDGGYDAEYIIESDHFDRIYLKDNNVIVNDLIERYELPEITNIFIPASFDSTNSTYSSVYNSNNPENGLTASNSSTRCCVYSNTGSNAVSKLIYNFDCSSIPENVTIDSVTCTAGASCYSNGQYFATRTLQLYSGDTAKGTATTITGNGSTNTSHTLNCGSWTREELNNIKIIVYIARSTSNNTTNASFSFFGASLSITYHANYYGYTIENVSAAHTLILSDRPTYQITSSSTANGVTITPNGTTTVYEGNDISFTIDALNITKIKVIDNNTDVTSSLTGSEGAFIYTIQDVIATHTVTVSNKLTIYLKDTNAWISCSKIFKKVNGNWVEQTSAENLFEANKIYVKG